MFACQASKIPSEGAPKEELIFGPMLGHVLSSVLEHFQPRSRGSLDVTNRPTNDECLSVCFKSFALFAFS